MTQLPFLQRLDTETVDLLRESGVKRNWSRRKCIFRKGDRCGGVHIVESGLVKLYRSNASGREQIVVLTGVGGVLTISPVLDRGEQPVTAETLKATTTTFVPAEAFIQLYQERPDLRDAVTLELTRRIRFMLGLLETIALKPVTARVATRLFELASAQDALEGSRNFRMLLSQDEVARVLGTSRESVARALGELRANGVIDQRGAHIRINDPQALFEWSNLTGPDPSTPLPAAI